MLRQMVFDYAADCSCNTKMLVQPNCKEPVCSKLMGNIEGGLRWLQGFFLQSREDGKITSDGKQPPFNTNLAISVFL